jgi:beta-lactamase regulating signal transducer with metallopeptidase domain
MMLLPGTHWIAALALDRMLYCLAEGTALALSISLILRLARKANSQTRFVVRLATLVTIAVLPFLGVWRPEGISSASQKAFVTIPAAWAGYILLVWMILAFAGLVRVGIGLWQIRSLRRSSSEIEPEVLGPQVQALIEDFRKSRPVSVLVSSRQDVPTAIGFFRPAIILPAWLVDAWLTEQGAAAELHHAILHELAHLRRRDDWTNLAQKIVKALLFFHPGVWWVERRLSLDREMACDDAVLAQTASARAYAQCLARMAEKSFLRRKMALAQAAVDRMRQLSLRVAQILNQGHPRTTRLWKPALPMMAVIAVVCAVSTSQAPILVGLKDQPPSSASNSSSIPDGSISSAVSFGASAASETPAKLKQGTGVAATPAVWHPSEKPSAIPARYSILKREDPKLNRVRKRTAVQPRIPPAERALVAETSSPSQSSPDQSLPATQQSGFLVMVVETHVISSPQADTPGAHLVQINTWEVRWYVPAVRPAKQIPRKT